MAAQSPEPVAHDKNAQVFTLTLLLTVTKFVKINSELKYKIFLRASGSAVNFDNVMTKFIIKKRTDAQKTDVNLFFTITRPQNRQMRGINKGKRGRKLAVNKGK